MRVRARVWLLKWELTSRNATNNMRGLGYKAYEVYKNVRPSVKKFDC